MTSDTEATLPPARLVVNPANDSRGTGEEHMRTRLTDLLQIEHPVMLAGMGGVSYHRLVAAVSEAGGIGTLGAAAMESEQMIEEIAAVRQATDAPFGVDLLAALPERMISDVAHIVAGGASLFVAGLGVPRDVVARCHDGGVIVASMCGKVRHAIAAAEALRDCIPSLPRGLRRAGPRGRAGPRRRRRLDRHALHRDARSARGRGLQGRAPADRRRRHRDQPRIHGEDVAGRAQRLDAIRRGAPRGVA